MEESRGNKRSTTPCVASRIAEESRRREKKTGTASDGRGDWERKRGDRGGWQGGKSNRIALLPAGLARRRRPCRAAARSVNVFSFFLALSLPTSPIAPLSFPPTLCRFSSCSLSLSLFLVCSRASLPALFHRSPHQRQHSRAASRTRDTGACCEIPLSSCERPSAARIIPRRAFAREISSSRSRFVVVVVTAGGESRTARYRCDTGRSPVCVSLRSQPEKKGERERARCAFGNMCIATA